MEYRHDSGQTATPAGSTRQGRDYALQSLLASHSYTMGFPFQYRYLWKQTDLKTEKETDKERKAKQKNLSNIILWFWNQRCKAMARWFGNVCLISVGLYRTGYKAWGLALAYRLMMKNFFLLISGQLKLITPYIILCNMKKCLAIRSKWMHVWLFDSTAEE